MLTVYRNNDIMADYPKSFLDSWFDDELWGWGSPSKKVVAQNSKYVTNVVEGTMTLDIDFPGVKKDDVKIVAAGQVLVVESSRDGKKSTTKFNIRDDFDPSKATAALADGVLHVSIVSRAPPEPVVSIPITIK